MKDLRVAGGGAGQQTFLVLSHQPLVGVCSHVASHIFLGPGLQPGLKASVQASVDPLVGLKEMSTTQFSYWDARYRNICTKGSVSMSPRQKPIHVLY